MSILSNDLEAITRSNYALEYTTLRNEILKRVEMRQQLTSLTLTIAGVFFSFGLNNSGIAFVYPLLAWFLATAWTRNDRRVRGIGDYIRECIEPRMPGLNWETHFQQERLATRNRGWRTTVSAQGGVFLFTQLIAIGIGLAKFASTPVEWGLLILDVLSIILVTRSLSKAPR